MAKDINKELIEEIYNLHVFTPNNQEYGNVVRQIIMKAKKEPVRTCEIEDQDCLNCGS